MDIALKYHAALKPHRAAVAGLYNAAGSGVSPKDAVGDNQRTAGPAGNNCPRGPRRIAQELNIIKIGLRAGGHLKWSADVRVVLEDDPAGVKTRRAICANGVGSSAPLNGYIVQIENGTGTLKPMVLVEDHGKHF